MPQWGGISCVGCGNGGAYDDGVTHPGGVCFDVSRVAIVSIQSDASVPVVMFASIESVPVSGCHYSLLGSGLVCSVTKLLFVYVFSTS